MVIAATSGNKLVPVKKENGTKDPPGCGEDVERRGGECTKVTQECR